MAAALMAAVLILVVVLGVVPVVVVVGTGEGACLVVVPHRVRSDLFFLLEFDDSFFVEDLVRPLLDEVFSAATIFVVVVLDFDLVGALGRPSRVDRMPLGVADKAHSAPSIINKPALPGFDVNGTISIPLILTGESREFLLSRLDRPEAACFFSTVLLQVKGACFLEDSAFLVAATTTCCFFPVLDEMIGSW